MTKKEAIEVIKTTMPYMWKETKEAIQTLIPEFAESDDEKIRKEIIDFLIYGIWNTTTIDNVKQSKRCAEWIAYLEKLKEQPTNEEMLRTLRTEYEKGVADTIAKYEQKEQKPVACENDFVSKEWNEEDKEHIKSILVRLKGARGSGEIPTLPSFTINEDINWIESLLRFAPYCWKKSLKTVDLENSLCDIQDNFSDCSYEYKIIGEAIEYIRSTEPHWKPSEEQMKALEETMDRNDKIGYILRTLRDDIKKNIK